MMEERKVIKLPRFPKVEELAEWVLVDFGEMQSLTKEEKKLEALLVGIRKRKAEVKQKLLEKFKEANADQLKITDHVVAIKGEKLRAALKSEKAKEACKAFKENGYEDLVTETIFPQRLTEWVLQFREDGELKLPEWAKEYIDIQSQEKIYIGMSSI